MGHWWNEWPWRLIQTNLRQIDMEDIDAKEYVTQLKDFGATVVMINVGGILASYESKVEDHTVSDYLTGDSLKTIMDTCHEADIKVIARMDFSKARKSVYDKHPEWAYRAKDGKIINYNGDVHMCFCGGFQQEKAFEIMRESAETLPIDGVFINMGGFQQRDYSYNMYELCHCENCKRMFKRQFGLDLPEKEDMNDSTYRKYKIFQKRMLKETNKRMHDMLKSINPELCIDGLDFSRVESNTEYQRKGPQWMYSSSSVARCETSLKPYNVCSNAAVDFIGFYYRHCAVSPAMQALRMSQDLANGIGLDYYLIGRLDNHKDRSGYAPIKNAFHYMSANDAAYKDVKVKGDVLLVRNGTYFASFEAKGWVQALTESHILLEEADPDYICSLEQIERFKAVIIADIPVISGELTKIMDEYVKRGGCLIITGQTGRYDEEGGERENIAFESIGAVGVKYYSSEMRSAIFEIGDEDKELFPSLPETEVVYFGDYYWYVNYDSKVKKHLHLIPPHSYGPPERCYYNQVTNLPGFTVNTYGAGKAIQIPWLPGDLYHTEGYDNTYFLIKDILMNCVGLETVEDEPFTPMIEVTRGYALDGSHAMIHLVNATGHFGRAFFEPVQVRGVKLKIALDRKPSCMRSLIDQREIPFIWENGYARIEVEKLEQLEAINVLF